MKEKTTRHLFMFFSVAGLVLTRSLLQYLFFYTNIPPLPSQKAILMSSMNNQGNLLSNGSWNRREKVDDGVKKVAFMFLARGSLPLRALWEKLFEGYDGFFSIYVHTSPEFEEDSPETSVFFNRRIPSRKVVWGQSSMVDAEKRLLSNALVDLRNSHFVLLSESCIPLVNFTTIYEVLVGHDRYSSTDTTLTISYVGSFDDPTKDGRGRYNKMMLPLLKLKEWRKGSQWFVVGRKLAGAIAGDEKYYRIFNKYCSPRSKPSCYMDEHYVPTLVTKLFPDLNSNRSLTWTDWSGGGSHPASFSRRHVTAAFLRRVRTGSRCRPRRRLGLHVNATVSACGFLFARKFDATALQPLLELAPELLGFGP